jgi:hypothetical protein
VSWRAKCWVSAPSDVFWLSCGVIPAMVALQLVSKIRSEYCPFSD